jgi:hypothetical protein
MSNAMSNDKWMSCSACRKDIPFGARHWICSVSTCNKGKIKLVFCSVPCWDSHVAVLRHRDAWAVEADAPTREEWAAVLAAAPPAATPTATPSATPSAPAPERRAVSPAPSTPPSPAPLAAASDDDILIVVSKMKKYIRDRSGMNTSDAVAAVLSDHVRAICDLAIRTAAADGRKTVLDRDVPSPRR